MYMALPLRMGMPRATITSQQDNININKRKKKLKLGMCCAFTLYPGSSLYLSSFFILFFLKFFLHIPRKHLGFQLRYKPPEFKLMHDSYLLLFLDTSMLPHYIERLHDFFPKAYR